MQPSILLILSAVFALPATIQSPSGVVASKSGVLTATNRFECGTWSFLNRCSTGYSCIEGYCVSDSNPTPTTTSTTTAAASVTITSLAAAATQVPDIVTVPVQPVFSDPVQVPTPIEAPAPIEAPIQAPIEAPVQQPTPIEAPAPVPVVEAPVPVVQAPAPVQVVSGGSSTTFTYYDPSTGGGACTGTVYSSSSFIVAIATDIYQGGAHCGSTIYLTANGRTVQATVVDECNVAGGCRSGNIDSTFAVWGALGIDTGLGVTHVEYHF